MGILEKRLHNNSPNSTQNGAPRNGAPKSANMPTYAPPAGAPVPPVTQPVAPQPQVQPATSMQYTAPTEFPQQFVQPTVTPVQPAEQPVYTEQPTDTYPEQGSTPSRTPGDGEAVSKQKLFNSSKSALLKGRIDTRESERKAIAESVEKEVIKITDEERALVDKVTLTISEKFKREVSTSGGNISDELRANIEKAVAYECSRLSVDYEVQKRVEKTVIAGIIGLGPLDPYMNDKKVTEIIVQRWDNICIEREGKIYRVKATFTDEQHLQTVIQRIVQPIGRQINRSKPIVDARLADGSRVCATIPPASPDGATLDIRRFFEIALTGEDYIRLGSMSPEMLEFLQKSVQARASIIVSGGTGTGKTTLLNMLSSAIPKDELIVTIEDSCELKLDSPNVRRLETKLTNNVNDSNMNVDIRLLVKTSLRMRPDRIIVGEIRDGTITDMVSAMSTGHEGSMCTVHANSAINLVRVRLPMLYSMSDTSFSEESQNIQIAEALDLIVQIKRYGKLRAVQSITEVQGTEHGKVKIQDIFRYDDRKKEYYATGYVPRAIIDKMIERGVYIDENIFKSREVKKKEELERSDAASTESKTESSEAASTESEV